MEYLRIGTRSSKLALWQTNFVVEQLTKLYPSIEIEIVHIKTTGDKILNSPLSKIGGKGLFTKEIELKLLNKEIDLAVHSLKDVPSILDDNFSIPAVLKREFPFDAFVSNKYQSINQLPINSIVGTSSLRRTAQLLMFNPQLKIENLRGNIDTRLKKLDDGNFDAIILASAGLIRLGYRNRINEILSTDLMLPAVAQGALAIETLSDNFNVIDLIKPLDDFKTHIETDAERSFLRVVEGGCQVPIGVFAQVADEKLIVEALISSVDGKNFVRDKLVGNINQAINLGQSLAEELLNRGGCDFLP